jgi:hypothetical protein
MIVKLPKNLKVFFFYKRNQFVLQFINKYGVIKKKIRNINLNILKFKKGLNLKNLNYNQYIFNNIFILRIIINKIMFYLFKIFKDRLILEGVGYKV